MSEFKKLQEKLKRRDMDVKFGLEDKQKAKQQKHDKLLKFFGIQTSEEWIRERKFKEDTEYNSIPLNIKQKFLDHMHNDRMNVGEASKACGISSDMGAQIIIRNGKHSTLEMWPTKAIE